MDDLVDFYLVDVEMDDLGVGRKVFHVACNAVVKPRAYGDEQVALRHGHVGGVRAVHAYHAQMGVVRIGHGPLAHEGRNDRHLRFLDDVPQGSGHIGEDDAAARQKDGALRLFQRRHGAVDIVSLPRIYAAVAPQLYRFGIFIVEFGVEYVLGYVDEDRAGPARRGDVKGFPQHAGQVLDVLYQVIVLRNRRRDPRNVGFLEGIAADEGRRDLPADDDERDRVHVGRRNTRDHVAHAGARRGEAYARLARRPGVAVGSVDGALFVAC